MSHSLADIVKAVHACKGNAIIDVERGEVKAVYLKENLLSALTAPEK